MNFKIQKYEHSNIRLTNEEQKYNNCCSVRASMVRLFGCSIVLLFLFFFQPPTAYCQLAAVDSLTALLKTDKEDTNKVNHLNAVAWELKFSNPDSSIVLGNKALLLSKSLNWKNGIANSFGNLGSYYYLKDNYPKALENYFAALKINDSLDNRSETAIRLGNIGNVYASQGDFQKALDYYLKAMKMAEELNDKKSLARHLGNIGNVYSQQNNLHDALDFYTRALALDETLGDRNGIARHLGNIGIIYTQMEDYPKALDNYLKSLNIYEEIDDINGIETSLGNIGALYLKAPLLLAKKVGPAFLSGLKAAEYFLIKAVELSKEIGDV